MTTDGEGLGRAGRTRDGTTRDRHAEERLGPETISVPVRVRFDEAGPDGLVRASALLRYVQECAWIHSEALGFGREWYVERGLTWVVRSIGLAVVGTAGTGSALLVSTSVVGFRRVWARRRAVVRHAGGGPGTSEPAAAGRPMGDVVATIDTDWVMTDIVRGMPTRVPDEFPRAFRVPPGSYEPTRVTLPPAPYDAVRLAFEVRPHELDPLEHANHAVYLDWLEEAALALPEGRAALAAVPRTYRLEYASPATPGRPLVGAAWRVVADGGIAYRLRADASDGVAASDGVDASGGADGSDLFRGQLLTAPG